MATVRELIRVLRGFKGGAQISLCQIQIDTHTIDLFFEIRLAEPGEPDWPTDGFEVDADGPTLPEAVPVSNVINFRRKR
ncbi:MAG TPA: hypothetical protein VKS60_03190 [Stellaceae bacterium]|nr:hypothetical protein [Stellaceae bacterium]